eukprot:3776464-Lingulodinium_polyedra.AAC.1
MGPDDPEEVPRGRAVSGRFGRRAGLHEARRGVMMPPQRAFLTSLGVLFAAFWHWIGTFTTCLRPQKN